MNRNVNMSIIMFFSSKNAIVLDKIVDFHYTNYYNVDTLVQDNSLLQIDTETMAELANM